MRKHFNDYGSWIHSKFPFKVQKISIDAGFSCPNRDGRISQRGCIYCDNRTFNPSYCNPGKGIKEQIREGKIFFGRKYPDMKYLAYFQAFTNTYAPLDDLKRLYEEALQDPDIVGLVIGTRPDCVSDELLDYLAELSHKTFLIVEYGIESANDETLKLINRGHGFKCCEETIRNTREGHHYRRSHHPWPAGRRLQRVVKASPYYIFSPTQHSENPPNAGNQRD